MTIEREGAKAREAFFRDAADLPGAPKLVDSTVAMS
jgi:hypothetical protein